MINLYFDFETYSSIDIKKAGHYKYTMSCDFEILIVAYAFDNGDVVVVDLTKNSIPLEFIEALRNPNIVKHAHNATFERQCLKAYGLDIPVPEWSCSAIKAGYCGLPLSLAGISKALDLKYKKQDTGTSLINFFTKPQKTGSRNLPADDIDKWHQFMNYCKFDVLAEREICQFLETVPFPSFEQRLYCLDQKINDGGVLIDVDMAKKAIALDTGQRKVLTAQIKRLTNLDNPNSPKQLKEWLSAKLGKEITSLTVDSIPMLIKDTECEDVRGALEIRQQLSKTSIKKYEAMLNCVMDSDRAHGLFQFHGAKTGRWAGRLIQLHNLPRNYLGNLDELRESLKRGDPFEGDTPSVVLSQLIRTALIPPKNKTFVVVDASAIEARVTAWYAGEQWRLDVFNSHGKIYEASASLMFKVPLDEVDKDLRAKGKVAELAFGFQGAVEAAKRFGGVEFGWTDQEMQGMVSTWRGANRKIVALWGEIESCAIRAVQQKTTVHGAKGLIFKLVELELDGLAQTSLSIQLPSGRCLFYCDPKMTVGRFGSPAIKHMGVNDKGHWSWIDTYGGKLVENIVQATARDVLGETLLELDRRGYTIPLHVHDEVVAEVALAEAPSALTEMCKVMGSDIPWAPGLPLKAEGFITRFYKKD